MELVEAVRNNDVELTKQLLDRAYSPNTEDYNSVSVLEIAITKNNLVIIKELIKKGADINHVNKNVGYSPLSYASNEGLHEIVDLLVDMDANVEQLDNKGNSLIMLALDGLYSIETPRKNLIEDYVGTVKILLDVAVDPDVQNEEGNTALHFAAMLGFQQFYQDLKLPDPKVEYSFVYLLLHFGADPNIQNNDGRTCLHVAATYGHIDVASELLFTENVEITKVDIQDNNGNTALHLAAMNGHEVIASFLLEAGATYNILNYEGQSVYEVATSEVKSYMKSVLNL